jgi:redox-sensitive bicupin YhaK (pirin superfamily)
MNHVGLINFSLIKVETMDRKNFIKKTLAGAGVIAAGGAVAAVINNNIDELAPIKKNDPIGFNHHPNAETIMTTNTVLHKAETRGKADLGWLKTKYSFSFANYYNPDRMNFGVLRVLNDDFIAAGMGFGTHPHDNMEIITIPLDGVVEHKDSMGNSGTITAGEVQVMSAGTGIYHSEFNHHKDQDLRLFQIWIFPNKANVTPRYDQITLPKAEKNSLQQILSPNANDAGVWIHQDAWFHLGTLDEKFQTTYTLKKPETNGVYAFIIEGDVTINDQKLNARDGYGLWNVSEIKITADSSSRLLLMEVPMNVG